MTVKITVNGKEFDSINEAVEYAKEVENKSGVWEPEHDGQYWYVGETGCPFSDVWMGRYVDRRRAETGSAFKTKEDAECGKSTGELEFMCRNTGFGGLVYEK